MNETFPQKIKLVISDVHLGEGQEIGDHNPWHNFLHDQKLCEFLEYYSSGIYEECEVELIIAGDFVDFLQIRYNGSFPVAITEEISSVKFEKCIEGHHLVWEAFKIFLAKPGKRITVIPGNHDLDLYFPRIQQRFREAAAGVELSHKIRFYMEGEYKFDNVLVKHGHEHEVTNSFEGDKKTFIGSDGEPILNLPWGSYYHILVLNPLKKFRSYIDRVFPLKLYLLGALFLDTKFALKLIWMSFKCLFKTRFTHYNGRAYSFANTLKIMKESFSILGSLEKQAVKILEAREDIDILILGHSHGPKIRRYKNKLYLNSGTWTHSISLNIASLGTQDRMTYIKLQYYKDNKKTAHLMVWNGFHNVSRELLF